MEIHVRCAKFKTAIGYSITEIRITNFWMNVKIGIGECLCLHEGGLKAGSHYFTLDYVLKCCR